MLYDISPELAPDSAVFPGDTAFSVRRVMRMAEGGSCDVSTVTMSVHTGAHADAPSHFRPGAPSISEVPLDAYLGRARLVDVAGRGAIEASALQAIDLEGVERLLLRTGSAPDPTVFPGEFGHLSLDAACYLTERRLRLVGIDTPSMDHVSSKVLGAHQALLDGGVAILENLILGPVPAGDYELIALPLRLRDLDASPVRAVLRPLTGAGS